MSYDEFLDITPLELFEAVEYETSSRQYSVRITAEAIRLSTQWLVNIQLPRRKRIRNAKKFMHFPWDKSSVPQFQTNDQMKQVMKSIADATKHLEKRDRYSAHRYKRK